MVAAVVFASLNVDRYQLIDHDLAYRHESPQGINEQPDPAKKPPKPAGGLTAGERERLRFPLSAERAVRIIFSRPKKLTQAEIDDLMDYLNMSRRTFPTAGTGDTSD